MAEWESAPTKPVAAPEWESAGKTEAAKPGLIDRGLDFVFGKGRKEGAAEVPALPDTAPQRAPYSTPPTGDDPKALFEKRATLPKGTSDHDELTKKLARSETQTAEGAAAFTPLGKIGGGIAKATQSVISPTRALLAKEALDKFGIPLSGPQIGMNPTTKFIESTIRHIPFSGAGAQEQAVREAYNRAVTKTIGENSPVITQQVMSDAKRRIGGTLNQIEAAARVKLGNGFVNRLADLELEARTTLSDEEFKTLERQMENVVKHLQPGDTLEGGTYANLLHQGSPLDRAVSSENANIAFYAGQIRDALQDALQQSLEPSMAERYREARFQYKNMKTIEPLVNASPDGNISPARLSQRVTQQFENRAYDATGENPLDRLGKIGQAFLKEPGTSGTSERGATKAALVKAGELAGAAAAGSLAGIPATVGGAAAALGAGRLAGNYLRSPGLARRTIDRALVPRAVKPPPEAFPNLALPIPQAINPPLPGTEP